MVMKLRCYSCNEKVNAMDGNYCDSCGQFICCDCYDEHISECKDIDFDIDDYGNCYSDADQGL